ncbi:hypothetical protein EOE18_16555 [Novosphingobium umbonatum]|uniref:Uncharacterized protein n=1 Tax=Novosphingobium umbonatum TaxID=1908524 RepID=A0A3S2VQV6_9SPHN|nr:hypothetical protein [Novosphingobium umbonatum]RVU03315.1 hypothetical protein EOE18_16555 [Novosphingobium umbonatum]
MLIFLKLLWALAVFWHVLAFCQGGYCVLQAYASLFDGSRDPLRQHRIKVAEWHLWASGLAIIALGILLAGGLCYFQNPKLWTKLVVVIVWLATSLMLGNLRHISTLSGRRSALLLICSISAACWLYGAFLGVAKSLANGAVPFGAFISGFGLTILGCIAATFWLERRHTCYEGEI